LEQAQAFYARHGAPLILQTSPVAEPKDLEESLASLGFVSVDDVYVMTRWNLKGDNFPTRSIALGSGVASEWIRAIALFESLSETEAELLHRILGRVRVEQRFATKWADGQIVAVGRVALQDGWAGFFNVATDPRHRREGHARDVMNALMRCAADEGARRGYLQVDVDNRAATRLYSQLEYAVDYLVRFMKEPAVSSS
jgi:ribosomal protein S18 acetylase RimI-like enzyme